MVIPLGWDGRLCAGPGGRPGNRSTKSRPGHREWRARNRANEGASCFAGADAAPAELGRHPLIWLCELSLASPQSVVDLSFLTRFSCEDNTT